VDADCVVRMSWSHNPKCGFNFYEPLRVLDSMQLCEIYQVRVLRSCHARGPADSCSARSDTPCAQVHTPAHWAYGDDVLVDPTLDDEQVRDSFPRGVTQLLPYLKITPAPDMAGEEDGL
jgi:thioredoxin-dependent peroxiredoxin